MHSINPMAKGAYVWYWVDTYSEEMLDTMKGRYIEVEVMGEDGRTVTKREYQKPRVLHSSKVYGIKTVTGSGEALEEPWRWFIRAINIGRKKTL